MCYFRKTIGIFSFQIYLLWISKIPKIDDIVDFSKIIQYVFFHMVHLHFKTDSRPQILEFYNIT